MELCTLIISLQLIQRIRNAFLKD
uniref:Uncharacterized protein n=1 Tax=Anguilla anguilla TaxID=7936 RepID=A0A0E9Q822_ANGAN